MSDTPEPMVAQREQTAELATQARGEEIAPTGPPTTRTFSLGNRPALTGIRAVGVSLVLIFHSNFQTLPGSWVVLGVFFVLSGFLITSMLATENQRTGRISLSKFYSRRAVRLLPPLFLTIALLAIYASIVHVTDAAQRIWGDSAAAMFYYADYRQAFEHNPLYSGYLTQCWSLAVEEQFYLIWAALLLVALKFGRRRIAYAMACVGIIACTANRLHIVLDAHPWTIYTADRTYYAFDTRADALFVGCLLGLIATGGHLDGWKPMTRRALSAAALVSTCVMAWIIVSRHPRIPITAADLDFCQRDRVGCDPHLSRSCRPRESELGSWASPCWC